MKKIASFISLAMIGAPLLVQAHTDDGFYGHHMGMGNAWGGAGYFGGFFLIIFWVLIIIAVVFLIKALVNSSKEKAPTDQKENKTSENSLEILKNRYAKGEIKKEEFEKIKKDLIS